MPACQTTLSGLILALLLGMPAAPALAQSGISGPFLAAKTAISNSEFRAADLWYQKALALAPTNPEVLGGALVAALALGDVPRAARLAQDMAAQGIPDPTADLALLAGAALARDYAGILQAQSKGTSAGILQDDLLAGWAHIGLGQMNDGLARMQKATETPGLASFGLYHSAIASALAGDFDSAVKLMEATAVQPIRNSRRGAVFYAQVLSQAGQGDKALLQLQDMQRSGQSAQIAAMIAQLQAGQPLAITGFSDAGDGLAEAFFSLASALGADIDPTYILFQARIAAAMRPNDTEAVLLTAGLLERIGQFDLAAETYGQIAPSSEDFPMAEIGRAEAVYSAGRKQDSLQILRELAAARPRDIDVQIALGNGLRRAEDHAQAIAAYTTALGLVPQIGPEHWALFYSRAISLEAKGDFPRAESDFRKALELNPDQPSVLNYLGYSLVDRGLKLDEALDMIKRAVQARPEAGYIVDSLAWAYFRLGRFAEALEPMERAALLEPIDPVVTDHLGDVYWANGRKREAVFQWRRALSFNPSEKDAARIRLKLELGLDAVRAREGDPPFPPLPSGG